MHCSSFRLVTAAPLALISFQLVGKAVTMGPARRSSVSMAFARSRKGDVRDGVCAWVVEFVGSARGVAVGFVTLFISWEVCAGSTIAEFSAGIAYSNDAKV